MSVVSTAAKRLLKELRELELEPSPFGTARPINDSNMFEWHLNIVPRDGAYAGLVLHLHATFDDNYPVKPPVVRLKHSFKHPNVFKEGDTSYWICLDMLKPHMIAAYSGWSASYSMSGLLIQLYSFLLEADRIPQEGGTFLHGRLTDEDIASTRRTIEQFVCTEKGCRHTLAQPHPPVVPASVPCVSQSGEEKKEDNDNDNMVTKDKPFNFGYLRDCKVLGYLLEFLRDADLFTLTRTGALFRNLILGATVTHQRNLHCYFTKDSYRDSVLGIGVIPEYFPNNRALKSIISNFDFVSEGAVLNGVRRDAWNKPFDNFLPLFINSSHWARAMPSFERACLQLYRPPSFQPPSLSFQPMLALEVVPRLMNGLILSFFETQNQMVHSPWVYGVPPPEEKKAQVFSSEKALLGFCQIHHLFLGICKQYPAVACKVDETVEQFKRMDIKRNKSNVPDLGIFICLLSVSSLGWSDVCASLLEEVFGRNVLWVLKADEAKWPQREVIENTDTSSDRLAYTFEANKLSLRLLCFQYAFLNLVVRREPGRSGAYIRESMLKEYNKHCGVLDARLGTERLLQRRCTAIRSMKTFQEFFRNLNMTAPTDCQMTSILKQAILTSESRRYHSRRSYFPAHARFARFNLSSLIPVPPKPLVPPKASVPVSISASSSTSASASRESGVIISKRGVVEPVKKSVTVTSSRDPSRTIVLTPRQATLVPTTTPPERKTKTTTTTTVKDQLVDDRRRKTRSRSRSSSRSSRSRHRHRSRKHSRSRSGPRRRHSRSRSRSQSRGRVSRRHDNKDLAFRSHRRRSSS